LYRLFRVYPNVLGILCTTLAYTQIYTYAQFMQVTHTQTRTHAHTHCTHCTHVHTHTGNGGSHDKCRRRWDLCDSPILRYKDFVAFDRGMTHLEKAFGFVSTSQYVSRKCNSDKLVRCACVCVCVCVCACIRWRVVACGCACTCARSRVVARCACVYVRKVACGCACVHVSAYMSGSTTQQHVIRNVALMKHQQSHLALS
jgi:hypothetical protein